MTKHRTEEIYDNEMAPLVSKLIEIAKREKIPMLVSVGMFDPDGDRMSCDTKIPGEIPRDVGVNNRHALAFSLIRGHDGFDTAAGLMISQHHREDTP